jgi:hypothetical protein
MTIIIYYDYYNLPKNNDVKRTGEKAVLDNEYVLKFSDSIPLCWYQV